MSRTVLLCCLAIALACSWRHERTASAQDESDSTTVKVEDSGFKLILQRIRAASRDEGWKADDWSDPVIEKWLSDLESELAAATKRGDLKLPVAFDDVTVADPAKTSSLKGVLTVEKTTMDVTRAANSIILSDANVQVSFADNCVIVARGAVTISHARNCFVIAGEYVDITHARSRVVRPAAGGAPLPGTPTVVLCGGPIEVSHAANVVCSSPRQITMSFAEKVDLINSPLHKASHGSPNAIDAKIGFDYQGEENPIRSKFQVTETVRRGAGKSFAVVRRGDVEYVVREGAQVMGMDGKPLPGVEDWKLEFVANRLAIFSDGERFATFPVSQ
jgi:hypothetical protein